MASKRVAITGAAGGIGTALSKRFRERGFEIIALDYSEDGLTRLAESVELLGTHACDVTDRDALRAACEAVEKSYGVPDVWVNNAGIAELGLFRETTQEAFEKVMDVNVTALVRATRYWLEAMATAGRGTIVNIASVAGHVPTGGMASYVASKHAVVGFTRSLQQEVEADGVPVNLLLVSPGFVHTPIIRLGDSVGFPKRLQWMLATPEKCAKEIVRAVEKGASFVGPTLNGKIMLAAHRFDPALMRMMGRRLFKRALRDLK